MEPGLADAPVIRADDQVEPGAEPLLPLAAEVEGVLGRQRRFVALGGRPMGVLLDLAVGQSDAAIDREAVRQQIGEIQLRAAQLQLVDGGHHPQQPERSGEELEELVVIDVGLEHGGIELQALIQVVALEAELERLRHLLVVLVVDVEAGTDRAEAEA